MKDFAMKQATFKHNTTAPASQHAIIIVPVKVAPTLSICRFIELILVTELTVLLEKRFCVWHHC